MKYYIYLFVFFLFSCSNHHSLDNVAVKQLPDLGDLTKRMEFYVVSEDSASAYSFIFYNYGLRMLGMSIHYDVDGKESDNESEVLFDDTTAVSKFQKAKRTKYKKNDYNTFLHEFSCCMKRASSEYELSELKQILFELTCFQDKSYEVAKSIIKNNNTRKPTYSEVEKAINNTSLKKDFDNILKQYDLKTSKIICGDSPIIIFRRTDLTDLGKRNYDRELGLSVLVRIRLDKLSLP